MMVKSPKTNLLYFTSSSRCYSATMNPPRMMLLLVLIVNLCVSFSNGNTELEAPKEPAVDIQNEGTIQHFNLFFNEESLMKLGVNPTKLGFDSFSDSCF